MKKKAVINKEEAAENWCFICKDGGDLRICDYGECLKSYHSSCLGKDDSFLDSDEYWACAWHTCFNCRNRSYLHCYTCTHAVCGPCLPDADFLRVKGKYGFCSSCLYLALLIEDEKEHDSDGEMVDFTDRETCEGLFMEYYVIIKEKEGFESGYLHAAKDGMKTKDKSESGTEEFDEEEDQISDSDGAEHMRKCRRTCNEKRSGRKNSRMQTPMKSNKNDFIGWGSISLFEFLSAIGKRTDEKLSQRDVTSIINEYVKENKLLHRDKKRLITCDGLLQSLFRKRTLNKHKVYELLEAHFAENRDESEEDEVGDDSEDDSAGIPDVRKRKGKRTGKLDVERKSPEKELADFVPQGRFALIVVENVKLVYLKRSLILEMLKQPKTFEEKVVGCFIRVKSDIYDHRLRKSHQLMKVRGVRRVSVDQNNMEVILLVSAVPEEISMSMLSDDDFSKEECEDLRRRVLEGQLERPTVEGLQQKANILHADITKHWISKELALLRNLIDRANEKGWRYELFEYRQKQRTLQNPSEVSKLLENVPQVIPDPDLHELIHVSDDITSGTISEEDSPESILQFNSSITNDGWQDHKASEEKTCEYNSSAPEIKQLKAEDDTVMSKEPLKSSAELKNNEPDGEELDTCSQETIHEQETRNSHEASETVVIDLLNCDENSNEGKGANNVHEINDLESNIWYLQTPDGERNKYSLSVLKEWSETSVSASKFKVWKENEKEEDAVWLHEVLSIAFPKK